MILDNLKFLGHSTDFSLLSLYNQKMLQILCHYVKTVLRRGGGTKSYLILNFSFIQNLLTILAQCIRQYSSYKVEPNPFRGLEAGGQKTIYSSRCGTKYHEFVLLVEPHAPKIKDTLLYLLYIPQKLTEIDLSKH